MNLTYRSPLVQSPGFQTDPGPEEQVRRLQAENAALRREVRVAQESANLTAQLVIQQFEQTELILQRLQAANASLNALHETTLGLMGQLNLNELLKTIIIRAGALLGTRHGYIYLVEPDGLEMQNRVGTGVFEVMVGHRIRPGEGLGGRVWQKGAPVVVDNYTEWEGRLPAYAHSGLHSLMGAPLTQTFDGGQVEVLGMIGLAYLTEERRFAQNEVQTLARFAALASIALLNANLYAAAQQEVIERRRAEEAAEAASHAKSNFLATMSHELRTPLNSILGFSEFISQADNLTPDQRDDLTIINRSGEHLLQLINNILDISKIEAGRTTLQEEDFDLHSLVYTLESILRMRAQQQDVALFFRISGATPQYVRSDPGKLRQVLMNLLSNAIKFAPGGQVRLNLDVDPENPNLLWFAVEDTGEGIAPDEVGQLFNAFAQTSSGKKIQQGTGLGLAISQAFVRLMGGEITVDSQPGQGSCFTFDIRVPAYYDAHAFRRDRAPARVLGLRAGQQAPDGGPFRLLVAEDVEPNWILMRLLLTRLGQFVGGAGPEANGFEIRWAHNGEEALQIWHEWRPHLIWMDIRMPVMDGFEATRHIKARSEGRATPVIALTATAFEEDRRLALSSGVDGFVRKPFQQKNIIEMLTQYLDLHFVYENPAPCPPAPATSSGAGPFPAVSRDWLERMQKALQQGEVNWQRSLVAEIRAQAPELAEQMAELLKNFELDELSRLIHELSQR